ncbi:MAG: primosomal protein N' [Ruminococcus sp.]|nr:primosomal protein N' [Ruminococcus sp.]
MNTITMVVKVALSEAISNFDTLYSYIVPTELELSTSVGVRVSVPFGKGNRLVVGTVLELEYLNEVPNNYKRIYSVEDDKPILNTEQIQLIYYLVDTTFCTYAEAIRTILPAMYTMKVTNSYGYNSTLADGWFLDQDEMEFLDILSAKKDSMAVSKYIEKHKDDIVVKSLIEKGIVFVRRVVDTKSIDVKSKMVSLSKEYILNKDRFKLSDAQKRVLKFIEDNGTVSCKETEYSCRVSNKTIKYLERCKAIDVFEYQPNNYEDYPTPHDNTLPTLTPQQLEVFNSIHSSMRLSKSECFLIHGVTGSGKTAIFERLIDSCIKDGKSAILLVPEISLTPQMVSRFKGAFGKRVALIHSGLSLKQREDEYCRIKDGLADIVIGTRSAIFVPLENIGIIIMDEEGESSYRSERSPRYSTKDIAKFRCKHHKCVLVLASATPSVESYYLAKRGIYKLLTLNKRYNNQELPSTTLVDMRKERQSGNYLEISNPLMLELLKNLENHEQSILLLNRRGYNTSIMCTDCGKVVECARCSVPLTYHKANHSLMCHYCGYSIDEVKVCPSCHSSNVKYIGSGTQKVAEEIERIFPTARVLRMDADTTFSKYAHEKAFKSFANGEYDILIGTQMVGKGLDFPNVTLTGIISADSMLYTGDFRSYERTFSLITQVIGRSGRGDRLGRAILQTYNPEHYIIPLAIKQDYIGFYNEEIALRRLNLFPPICDICTIGLSSIDEPTVQKGCNNLMYIIKLIVNSKDYKYPLRVMNPIKFTHERIDGKFRYKIVIKCKNNPSFRNLIQDILKEFYKHSIANLHIFVDINGDVY